MSLLIPYSIAFSLRLQVLRCSLLTLAISNPQYRHLLDALEVPTHAAPPSVATADMIPIQTLAQRVSGLLIVAAEEVIFGVEVVVKDLATVTAASNGHASVVGEAGL